jgi:DnaJ-class molecular chaperone
VLIDGDECGVTPVTVTDLTPGAHLVMVVLDGHEVGEKSVTLEAGGARSVTLALVASARKPVASAKKPAAAAGGTVAARETPAKRPAPPRHVSRMMDAKCRVCRGSGMMRRIGCGKCRGTGYKGIRKCPACSGKARVEYPCPYCKGTCQIIRGNTPVECRGCRGKGFLPCVACKGAGTTPRRNPEAERYPTRRCITCKGSGLDALATCTVCQGKGTIRVSRGGGILDATLGATRVDSTVGRYRDVKCVVCRGKGAGRPVCPQCRGKGYLGSDRSPRPCLACACTGHVLRPCRTCKGRGYIRDR